MNLTLPPDFPEIPGSDQCGSRPLHKAAKDILIAKKKMLDDFKAKRREEQKQVPLKHKVTLDGDDRIQIALDELYDKGGKR